MGINTLADIRTGSIITEDDIQQAISALKGDIVPRPASGAPTANAGSLGTRVYPFSAVHVGKIFQGGKEVDLTKIGTGGRGSITPSTSALNAVVSGLEPAGRPGMAGWLHQAGSAGVVITASSANPLIVKLDGTTYERTSNITGGTLPAAYSQSIGLPTITGYAATARWPNGPQANTRAKYRYGTGGVFEYDASNTEVIPAAYGDTFIIKSTGGGRATTYTMAQRASTADHVNLAKLAVGQKMNVSPTAQDYPAFNLPWNTSHSVIRCGYLFVDPLTATWALTISKRVVGSVDAKLPPAADYEAGDIVFREADSRYYRNSGSAWAKSSLVFLGWLAIDGGGVEAVAPVRSEASLSYLLEQKNAVLGEPVSREGVVDGDVIYFGGDTSGDLEVKSLAEMAGQSFAKIGSDASVDTSDADAGTLSNNSLQSVYYDPAAGSYFFEETPPEFIIYAERLLLCHPNRQRIFVGSFAVDGSGGLVAQQAIGSAASQRRHQLDERNDDTWTINPCLFGRSRCLDLAAQRGSRGYDRSVEIKIRGYGTSNTQSENTYRRTGIAFWNYNMTKPEDWDEIFYSYLAPYAIEQIYWNVQHDAPMKFELSQWDEASLLYATGLSAAAREGREAGTAGASGAIATIGPSQLDAGAVGADALGLGSVSPDSLRATNNPVAGYYPQVVQNNGEFGWSFTAIAAGGGTPDDGSVDYDTLASSLLGSEEDVLAPDADDLKLVNNLVLHDVLEDIRAGMDVFWGDWATPSTTNPTLPADNSDITITGTAQKLLYRNSSSYSLKAGTIPAGRLILASTLCTNPPALSSGTLRGTLLYADAAGTRWAMPITNPEGADAETLFRLTGSGESAAWNAVSYRGDELDTNWDGVRDNDRWAPMSGVAKHHPPGNAFNDETALAYRSGNTQTAIRAVYDTTNSRFDIVAAEREFMVPDGSVGLAQLDITGAAASKFVAINASNNGLAAVDAPSGGTLSFTKETLDTIPFVDRIIFKGSNNGNDNTLASGKSFADWDFIQFKLQKQISGTTYTYYTTMFPRDGVVGAGNEYIDVAGVSIDLKTNTTWKITDGTFGTNQASTPGIVGVIGLKYTLS